MRLFFLLQALAAWVAAIWLIDWKRMPELLVYGLWGAILSDVEDHIGFRLGLWEYRDTGPLGTHYDITILIINTSAAFLVATYFAQGLRPRAPIPWLRIAGFTAFSLIPEVTAIQTGHMSSGHWWNSWVSVLAYIPTWVSIWWLHRWLTRQERQKPPA